MAVFQKFQSSFDLEIDGDANLAFADESTINVVSGTVSVTFHGHFTYDYDGNFASGRFTGFDVFDAAHGGLQFQSSGFDVDAEAFFNAAASWNPDVLESLLMSGNDSLIGAAGDDTLNGWAGSDTLIGGAGNDLYVIDGQDVSQ